MFITEPAIATKCKLYNVEPKTSDGKWPVPLLDKLHATIVESVVDVEVVGRQVKNEPPEIVLILNGININIQVKNLSF